ncbi:MAG: DUF177 domain-containing protein [Bacteroidetes bacterium]|nr:DUF177 domain-containing protein [Bacteroidota bacterium]
MKRQSQYVIAYKGLKDGLHLFDFKVDDKFFEAYENSEIEKAAVDIRITMNKKPSVLEFEFKLEGRVSVPCDRCLDLFALDIEYEAPLFIKFGEETHEETDELIVISEHDTEIDVSQFIYEFIHLSLPYRRIHPEDKHGRPTCNEEMINRLKELSVNADKTETDPRWNDLKKSFLIITKNF